MKKTHNQKTTSNPWVHTKKDQNKRNPKPKTNKQKCLKLRIFYMGEISSFWSPAAKKISFIYIWFVIIWEEFLLVRRLLTTSFTNHTVWRQHGHRFTFIKTIPYILKFLPEWTFCILAEINFLVSLSELQTYMHFPSHVINWW